MKFVWSISVLFIVLILITGLCFGQSKDQQGKIDNPQNQRLPQQKQPQNTTVVVLTDESTKDAEQTRKQAEQNIAIQRELADSTRTLAKDTHDLSNYTLALVAIGFLVGGFQLYFLWGQSKSTQKAADAAKDTVDAMVRSERPWIGVKTPRNTPKLNINNTEWSFSFYCRNCGRTVARITEITRRFHIVSSVGVTPDLPPEPDYGIGDAVNLGSGMLIVPNAGFRFNAFFENEPTNVEDTKSLLVPLHEGRASCYAYARIKYIDTVSATERITQVCYKWESVTDSQFVIGGPPEYNKAT